MTVGGRAIYHGNALPFELPIAQLRLSKELQPALGRLYTLSTKVVGGHDSTFKNVDRQEKKSTLTVDFFK